MKHDSDDAIGATIASSVGDTVASSAGADKTVSAGLAAQSAKLSPVDPARYAITVEIGRGGLGRIMRARDHHLDRNVAIKELLHDDPDLQARFAREALVTARLMHPAIVPVYDAGTWPNGLPFYAMKMVSGRSLDEVIRTTAKPLSLLPNVIAVAEAIAYAHSEGIIHRDLKPANVLVGSFGETVVIDWGLAKDLRGPVETAVADRRGTETIVGSVMGTPSYMPPEQARGETVDARADVYAIGALLYHLLTGVPPFVGKTSEAVLELVLREPPRPLVGDLPSELVTIVGKAMAREPADRYPTAAELADDLKRFQTGGLVGAHVYSVRALVRRWIARNRAVVAVGSIATALLLAGGGYALHRIYVERDAAVAGEKSARDRADDAAIAQARAQLDRDPSAAIAALANVSLASPAWPTVRDIAAAAASREIATRQLVLGDGAGVVAILPNRDVIAYDKLAIYRWNGSTGAIAKIADTPHGTGEILLSPDGSVLAARIDLFDEAKRDDEGVRLIDLATGAPRPVIHAPSLERIAFTPDARRLVLATATTFSIVSIADATRVDVPIATTKIDGFAQLEVSRDGKFAAIATPYDVTRCDLVQPACAIVPAIESDMPGRGHGIAVAINAPGTKIVYAGFHQIGAYDQELQDVTPSVMAIDGELGHLGFSPDGMLLAGVTAARTRPEGGVLYLDDLRRNHELRWQTEAQLGPMTIDNDRVTLGASTGVVVVNVATMEKRWLRGQRDAITTIATRGTLIASASADGTVRLWDVRFAPLPCGFVELTGLARSGPIAVAAADTDFMVCDLATDTPRRVTPSVPLGRWRVAAIAPDGRRIAIATTDGVFVVQLATGEARRIDAEDFSAIAWSSAGITAQNPLELHTWSDALVPGRGGRLDDTDDSHSAQLSPDGRYLVRRGKTPSLVEQATGAARSLDDDWTFVFSDAGDRLASTSRSGELHVRSLATTAVQTFPEQAGKIGALAWAHDARTIATVGDAKLLLWDLATGKARVAMQVGGNRGVRSVAFSPDDTHLAVLTLDGTTFLIDVATLAIRPLGTLDEHALTVAYWFDGKAIVTATPHAFATWRDDTPREPAALHAWLVEHTMTSEAP